jgi:hypothetical protein
MLVLSIVQLGNFIILHMDFNLVLTFVIIMYDILKIAHSVLKHVAPK